MGVMDFWILHLFFYIFYGLFAYVWFQKTFVSSFVAVLVRGLPLPCIAGLLFSTSVPSFASLERPKGSKQCKNQRVFNILQRCQNRHKSLQHDLGTLSRPPSDRFDICEGPRQALRGRLLCFLAPLLLMFRAQEDAKGPKNIKTHTYSGPSFQN